MRLNSGNGTVVQIGRRTKKQDDRILVLRSIAGFLVVPGLAANIFVWSGYRFFQPYSYDNDLMSMAFALYFALIYMDLYNNIFIRFTMACLFC